MAIGDCAKLTYMNISHNRISSLPETLDRLTGTQLLLI